jgi:predicted metal-binding membrane protein
VSAFRAAASVLRSFARAPWPVLFALAGFGLILSAYGAARATLPAFCGAGTARLLLTFGWPDALKVALALNPPARLLADWASMLLAMMPPLLAAPLMHVWRSSLPRRRVSALACFAVGYGVVWMMAGPILIGLALLLQLIAGEGALAFAAAVLIAIVWSASPWQRTALNRSHRLRRIGLFGWAAYRECLAFGLIHAVWCIASCWAWMLAALAATWSHIPAMVFAGALMLAERLAAPERPRWRLPAFVSLFPHGSGFFSPQGAVRHG